MTNVSNSTSPYSSVNFLDDYGTNENKHAIKEGDSSIQIVPKEKSKCLCFNVDRSWFKIAALILNTGIFVTSFALSVQETLRPKPNISRLSIYDGLIGLTNFAFCAEIFASGAEFDIPNLFECLGAGKETFKLTGKEINRFLCAWSYAAVFIFSEGFDNILQHHYYTLSFIYALGWLKAKDIYSLLQMDHSKFEFDSHLAEESVQGTIPTLGFSTRDYSLWSKTWLAATTAASVGLTALNFAFRPAWGDFFPSALREYGKIGLYQTGIGVYSGSVLGDLCTRGYECILEKKEAKEKEKLIDSKRSNSLHAMRVGKTLFALFSPLMINILLGIRVQPNTVSDYMVKLSVGGVYGGNLLFARKEFENRASFLHRVSFSVYDDAMSFAEKAKAVAKKHFSSIAFFALLVTYFSVVAYYDSARDDYAILTFLLTMFFSYVLTDLVALGRERLKEYRAFNELVFRLLYGSIPLCIYYMLLSHLIRIGNQHLNHDSPALYGLQLGEWGTLGINMGNDRAVYTQPEIPGMLPITSPIAMTELTKVFVDNLKFLYANS